MTQWGYFLNIYGRQQADGYPDAYVVSCQHSMMRVMNEGRPLVRRGDTAQTRSAYKRDRAAVSDRNGAF